MGRRLPSRTRCTVSQVSRSIIDYFVRECVKREQPSVFVKTADGTSPSPGASAPNTVTAPLMKKGRTCKNMGAINVWTEKRKDDEVFKVYRRNIKNALAGLRLGKSSRTLLCVE